MRFDAMTELHGGFQIREHKPWRIWAGVLIVLLLMLISFQGGNIYQAYQLKQAELQIETQKYRIEELLQRNSELVRNNAQLERDGKVEHDAYQEVNQSLVAAQKEILKLKQDIYFYQGVVSPELQSRAVNIQSFELTARQLDTEWDFKLVLTKNGKSDHYVKGSFSLMINGMSEGEGETLKLAEMLKGYTDKSSRFTFRYFQIFKGVLQLPEGFEPGEVVITLKPETKKYQPITETVSWAQALSGGDQ